MPRCSKRCCEKTSDARIATTARELGHQGQELVATPCVSTGWPGTQTYRYASTRSGDGPIRHRLLELAQQRRRVGYRRPYLLLRPEGRRPNHKKLYRLYREEWLMVRKRGGHKRAIGTRAPMALPDGPSWSGSGAVRQTGRVEEESISGSSSPGGDRDDERNPS